MVLQDVFLFSGSVMDNITLRNPEISKEKVMEAARMIEMHDFIMQLPGGYDYNVMERGATLSLGQRQLLSSSGQCFIILPFLFLMKPHRLLTPKVSN